MKKNIIIISLLMVIFSMLGLLLHLLGQNEIIKSNPKPGVFTHYMECKNGSMQWFNNNSIFVCGEPNPLTNKQHRPDRIFDEHLERMVQENLKNVTRNN